MSKRCLKRRVFWLAPSMINSNCSTQAQKFETIVVTWFSSLVPIPWSKDCRGRKMKNKSALNQTENIAAYLPRETLLTRMMKLLCCVVTRRAFARKKDSRDETKNADLSQLLVSEPEKPSVRIKVKAK